jgi:hypothetical protein
MVERHTSSIFSGLVVNVMTRVAKLAFMIATKDFGVDTFDLWLVCLVA